MCPCLGDDMYPFRVLPPLELLQCSNLLILLMFMRFLRDEAIDMYLFRVSYVPVWGTHHAQGGYSTGLEAPSRLFHPLNGYIWQAVKCPKIF